MKIQIIWEGSLLTEILLPLVKTYRSASQAWKAVNYSDDVSFDLGQTIFKRPKTC